MKTTSTRQDQGIPGVYGLLLLDVVSRWGYNDETLFAPFRLTVSNWPIRIIEFQHRLQMNW